MSDGLDLVLPLEKAVCSHGLFMMAPNQWDPLPKTLLLPLRLLHSQPQASVLVRVSQPHWDPHSLHLCVYGTHSLSTPHRQSLLVQVSRMLRLSETEERAAREFRKMWTKGADADGSFGGTGRVFRSPTLFEDMVKCILLCNCQSMQENPTFKQCREMLNISMGSMHHFSSWHTGIGAE
ncbi:uncharacterized protein LOC133881410 isoform X6 [Alnus glutinosa]|uniref:uncharacterized protein LOC133881410 isoform X6 n=1 Tax=Alnus glutinosa TaxID=3517 RepID=UPI002D77B2E4|nr:uncharacterized protein LOC133881410 isoform X6 [Alnus glutinosa]